MVMVVILGCIYEEMHSFRAEIEVNAETESFQLQLRLTAIDIFGDFIKK